MTILCRKPSIILAGTCLAATFTVSTLGQTNSEVLLSFGRVSPDQEVEEVIVFNNPTREPLTVASIQLTPPLLAKEISELILPGQEGNFTLVLGENRPYGPYEGQVRINFENESFNAIVFEIEGFIIPPIEFDPFPAFFVATHSGKQKTASIEILNHREEPLLLTSAESSSERFTAKLETLEEGQRYQLSLTLDGNAAPGTQTDEITLLADPPLEQPLKVQANTKIRERVYHFPDTVDMGALPFKAATDSDAVQTLSQILMVYRPDTSDFEVGASINLDYVDLDIERGPDGDRYQMTLTLIPGNVSPGLIEGVVRIETNDRKFSVLEVPVSGYILE
jgi:hypothetical protein